MAVVDVRGITKSFRSVRAVDDLSLSVPQGTITGFLGPNGAGKSTTIRMIMSILRPDTGRIDVLGGDAWTRKDRIGYLPEERGVYRKMKVEDFLAFIAKLKGVTRRGMAERIQQWLERIELPHVAKMRCEDLSKGMQQKVQFAAALVHEPDLVILDEPFSGLDPVNADVLHGLIVSLRDEGRTVIFSTHVLHQAERICDRFVLINGGRKLLDSTIGEMRTQFAPRTVRVEFLAPVEELAIPGVERATGNGRDWRLLLAPDSDPQEVVARVTGFAPVRLVELGQVSVEEVFRQLVAEARS